MNNYYVLIYLTDHLNNKFRFSRYRFSISPHRNVWEAYFENPDGELTRLIYSTTPGETALFTDRYRAPKKSNVLHFFESLNGSQFHSCLLSENDRLLTMKLNNEAGDLLFQPYGNKANLYQTCDGVITDSFRNRNELTGRPAPLPRKPKEKGEPDAGMSARKMLLFYDQKLPRPLLDRIINHYKLEDAEPARVREVVDRITNAMLQSPAFRILKDGNLCLIPDDLLPVENLETFDNINDAVRHAYYKSSALRRYKNRIQSFRPDLVKRIEKADKALAQLEQADKALERAGKYEEYGHLLMAHAHRNRDPSESVIRVNDFYNENKPVEIALKDHLTIAENAQDYYDRSGKAKRRVEESKRLKQKTLMEKQKAESLLQSLDAVDKLWEFDDWKKEHEAELQEMGILGGKKQNVTLPYRKTEVDGYDIWIGKNARSNDELTGRAHKEDMWLHARGAGGSHVVIRMNNHSGKPPPHVIRRAASYAAWHSKLRGSSLVPVIVAKRKYITKPKGAPAGTVRVQREEVELVSPEKP